MNMPILALKINEMDKVKSISDYKNQFLMALGMNRNKMSKFVVYIFAC